MNMDEVKENCGNWIDYAYSEWLGWVQRTKKDQYYLGESTEIYVKRMRDAFAESEMGNNLKKEEAWNLLERLKRLGTNIHGMRNDFGGDVFSYEQASIHLECAVVAYKMGDYQEATALLMMPISNFQNRSIHKAVSCWIYGCIQWQSQTHMEEALINWEKSHRIVTELAASNSFEQTFAAECANIAKTMSDAIREASLNNFPPLPPRRTGPSPIRGASVSKPSSSRLRMFPIIGSIPAGAPIGIVDTSTEEIMVDGFEINGHSYTAYNLKTGSEINVNQNHRYYLLRVSGESMNNALPVNIEADDYVLMVKQDAADSGDIVAAEIDGIDREATLKRYYHKDNKHILEPQSRNPALKEYLTFNRDFYIRGKAIAVLKRNDT